MIWFLKKSSFSAARGFTVAAPREGAPVILDRPLRRKKFRSVPGDQIGVLICAINDYGEPAWELKQCIADAQKIRRLMSSTYLIPARNIKTLFNEQCTKKNIIRGMDFINNRFAFRLYAHSGHGYRTKNRDTRKYVEGLVVYGQKWDREGMLLDEDIYRHLGRPERTWLWIDACHSGGLLDRGSNPRRVKAIEAPKAVSLGMIDSRRPRDFIGMLACGDLELAYENSNGGVFTTALHNLLAASPGLSYEEISRAIAAQIYGQTPQFVTPDFGVGLFQLEITGEDTSFNFNI